MTSDHQVQGWTFFDDSGAFRLENPHRTSYLYFPLANEAGMLSAITPLLNGDLKADQNTFLLSPTSAEDLHNSRAARNFWVYVEGSGPWSVTGNSAKQIARKFTDGDLEAVTLEAGFLWHKIVRQNTEIGLRAEIINFVPPSDDRVELMQVTLTNTGPQRLTLTPTAAIPIYGRSADNLRDHRHVTSLLHRIHCHRHGVSVCPTLSFDERGHQPNSVTYSVLGAEADGTPPDGIFPIVEAFIGEGGSLDWPEGVVRPSEASHVAGQSVAGYEAMGGLRFRKAALEPGSSRSYVLILAISDAKDDLEHLVQSYGGSAQFASWLERTQTYWRSKLDTLTFHTGDLRFDSWTKWVTLQPILRRLYGNSFLPYHDYGRGGRGWRDLWQDILALTVMERGDVSELLFGHFAGVRFDGSNATIIGSAPGEFKADRNDIPRVWMDHGAWPWLTTQLYIDRTGDLAFLLREQTYFKDHLIYRAQATDEAWQPEDGTTLRTNSGDPYRGSILEHILVQHLTAFFNVGQHSNCRLEGADWNDGMDMAPERGESVAFTALYAGNLRQLSEWVLRLEGLGFHSVAVAAELMSLLDTLTEPVDYASVQAKQGRLARYFESCRHSLSGAQTSVDVGDLSIDLAVKADFLYNHLRGEEWIQNQEGYAWFNGYYDDDGRRVEGDHPQGVRMTLTGQVFALMGGVATDEQAREVVRAADRYLLDPTAGGYRLNTDFGEVLLNLGRCFGYAFGHKENGAMFSHMAVMYANALYRRGLVAEGHQVLKRIYQHSQDFPVSRIYPGIPEYTSDQGRGMYPYLTGSASWYLLTLVTEVYGVKGDMGDLALRPKLVKAQFDEVGAAEVGTLFAGRRLRVVYRNPSRLDYGDYRIQEVKLDDRRIPFESRAGATLLPRHTITELDPEATHVLEVRLAPNKSND
jgi:cellobiose phosphorylase